MAYTYIGPNKVEWGAGSGSPESAYFNPKDIDILMNQPGAAAFNVMKAIVNDRDCTIAVAVTEKNTSGAIGYLQGPEHIIAFACPPLIDQFGGILKEHPFIDSTES